MKSEKIRAAQQSGKLTILFDSGIRTGSDIIKALALGAQAVICAFVACFAWDADCSNADWLLSTQWADRGYME